MINKKDIDWIKTTFCTYNTEKYLEDVPLLALVSYFVKLNSDDGINYIGEFELNGEKNKVSINSKLNKGYINGVVINSESFVLMFVGEDVNPSPIILKITGIDLDDYIEDIS